ncbi:VTT domain-containing protein [Pseudoduganella violaceinigra]|uniref:VTT domain-containing protein n=1 Tax=Pseudoduganella violaceinigra TaxID=246602 RepID=UPI00042306F3|nr:VTT domain-containing protein [Pseudoduganella violaceinigra]
MVEVLHLLAAWFLHLDVHLAGLVQQYGAWVYALLFVVVFIETGVVVFPFLPGDSLLFAAGAMSAQGWFSPWLLLFLLCLAAVAGDGVNFFFGALARRKALDMRRFIKQDHLQKTQKFFALHGGKTIVLARFMPIVRTLAPFVAGIGAMPAHVFLRYNVVGGTLWVGSLLLVGYSLGTLPWLQQHLTVAILGIVFLSIMPAIWGALRK